MTKVYRNRGTSAASAGWAMLIIGVFVLILAAGCSTPAHVDVCSPSGCTVPDVAPLYVPRCEDSDRGPCVGRMTDKWIYVDTGAVFPRGRVLAPCATEDGGPGPCVWVPAAMGDGTGDSGAYVYGVAGHGFPLPGEVS